MSGHPPAALPALVYWEDPVQTGAVFGGVLVGLVSLTSCSLITVLSYSCLSLLLGVLGVRLYSFVMVKAGKAEAGSDPLAKVVFTDRPFGWPKAKNVKECSLHMGCPVYIL